MAAVEEGRINFNCLRNVAFFLLMTSAAELLTLLPSVALYGESPLEPIQILWVNLVTDAMAAIPLGLEPGTGKELDQPPRDPRVGLLYPGMLLRILAAASVMSLLITWVFHHAHLPVVSPEEAHRIRQTVAFTGIVVFEWMFALQARSSDTPAFTRGFWRNRWLFGSMVLGLGMHALVVFLPVAHRVFHTRPLTLAELGWTLIPGVGALFLEEVRKRLAPRLFSAGQWVKGRTLGRSLMQPP